MQTVSMWAFKSQAEIVFAYTFECSNISYLLNTINEDMYKAAKLQIAQLVSWTESQQELLQDLAAV